jgi:hypothetical protein
MVVDTNGYDAVAEIESTGDKYGTAKYIRKRKKECEEQARQYLAEHPKTDLYVMHGYPTMFDTEDNDPDENYIQFTTYTEEEIRRIKELFFELWNEGFEDPSLRAKSFEDIPQSELSITEFEGANDELDALVWDRAREQDFVACWIDWLHPVHAYHFSTWEYNRTKDEMYPRKAHYRVQLTDEEYQVIKSHTVQGGEILNHFKSLEGVNEGALYHHERYDGKGYPKGLAGKEIPLIARIICVADSFDTMNSNRVYRKKLTKECIINEIETNKGRQFDPEIADVMLKLLRSSNSLFDL